MSAPRQQSPHDAVLWPRNHIHDEDYARIIESLTGASAIFGLLRNDKLLRAIRDDSDEPDEEDAPFKRCTVVGLEAAMSVCLDKALFLAEKLELRGPVKP